MRTAVSVDKHCKHFYSFFLVNNSNKQNALPEKCLYFVLFWSAFSRVPTEYGDALQTSSYTKKSSVLCSLWYLDSVDSIIIVNDSWLLRSKKILIGKPRLDNIINERFTRIYQTYKWYRLVTFFRPNCIWKFVIVNPYIWEPRNL